VLARGASDTLTGYCDGVQKVQSTVVAAGWNITPGRGLRLGTYMTDGASSANHFGGSLDDVAIYLTALTAQQVAEHYGLRTAVPSGLRTSGAAAVQRKVSLVGAGGGRVGGAAVITTARGRSFSALPLVSLAVYTALNVPAVTDRAPGGVHDVVPQNTAYPLVLFEVSEARQLGGFGTKPGAGELPEVDLRIHVFSQQQNLSEAQAILARAIACLTDPPAVLGYGSWAIFHDSTIDLGDQVVANVTVHELVGILRLYVEEGIAA
jgi:hypothetical protein